MEELIDELKDEIEKIGQSPEQTITITIVTITIIIWLLTSNLYISLALLAINMILAIRIGNKIING